MSVTVKKSAGILMYKVVDDILKVFIVHPGGPIWKHQDTGAWSIPKGEVDGDEDLLNTAIREFGEETGFEVKGPLYHLGTITQRSGKVVNAWAFEGDYDPTLMKSNEITIEYPKKSGEMITIPEVDRGDYFTISEASEKLNTKQVPFLERLEKHIHMKKLSEDIVKWLREYAVAANRQSFVIGVSGGVDSALVSTLCALTGLDTHCVLLPCHSKDVETSRGAEHIEWLMSKFDNVACHHIDLTKTFDAFASEVEGRYDAPLAFANTKSRLRMVSLYQIATTVGGLVVGTGNKVEDGGVGFCTKWGDSGVDVSPIADLMKSEVRQMCRSLGVLPQLSEAIPTDGLWDNARTDEEQLGATYDELEWAMKYMETPPSDRSDITHRQSEVLTIYNKWHTATRHKFDPIPVFIRNIS